MSIKTYRAKSLQEAIALIRDELGPDASLLHTREVGGGMLGRLTGSRRVEVAASVDVQAPSRFAKSPPTPTRPTTPTPPAEPTPPTTPPLIGRLATSPPPTIANEQEFGELTSGSRSLDLDRMQHGVDITEASSSSVKQLDTEAPANRSDASLAVLTDLIEANVSESIAKRVLDDMRQRAEPYELDDAGLLRSRLRATLAERFATSGPIATGGGRRLVALVGPTGVGKTTTIAKLAANFRLRERLRVGLITVDTYRVAAVEQLRTYADIIDLPMEIVSTPREMRAAVDRLSGLDLVLLDTAGRSPRDEVKIQELKSMLGEARPDETHLVLSTTGGVEQLASAAEQFRSVGATSVLLTKLDESTKFGHLLSLADEVDLPISYTTNGQDVPDDIAVATPDSLAALIAA
ncbi:MAG: flagellar biosynthesis protein FlhF [Planctomycetota bacterium]